MFYLGYPDGFLNGLWNFPENLDIAINIFNICLLSIPINSAFAVISSYYQSELNFKLPAAAQLLQNIAIIIIVVLFAGSIGTFSIVFGYVAGSILQLLVLYLAFSRKFKLTPFKISLSEISDIFSPTLLMIIVIESIS